MKENNTLLGEDIARLNKTYLLPETAASHVRRIQTELESFEAAIVEVTSNQEEPPQAYSVLEENLEDLQTQLKDIEDEQISVSERLTQIEKDDINARQKANVYVNRLHTIKRYMEKTQSARYSTNFLEVILYGKQ